MVGLTEMNLTSEGLATKAVDNMVPLSSYLASLKMFAFEKAELMFQLKH